MPDRVCHTEGRVPRVPISLVGQRVRAGLKRVPVLGELLDDPGVPPGAFLKMSWCAWVTKSWKVAQAGAISSLSEVLAEETVVGSAGEVVPPALQLNAASPTVTTAAHGRFKSSPPPSCRDSGP